MFESFKRMVDYDGCGDKQMNTFFWLLNPSDHAEALKLFEKQRPELAKQIAKEILAAVLVR
jgi:hypothetical protein